VSLTVVFRETALRNLARLRSEDKDAFTQVRTAIAALADDPRPGGVVAWGTAGTYRLHAGTTRILYEVDDQAAAAYVINIGIIS
jgi:mRNA-degrading endonuclease RelE of RelBE toxin-antitoxin system